MVPKNGLRQWDDDIAKIMDDRMNVFKKYISSKSIEDKIESHCNKRGKEQALRNLR
jgi:hypothetical protein